MARALVDAIGSAGLAVSKDAAELTTTPMRTGREDTPMSLAAEIEMGITTSTVAVLLIS